MHDIYEAHRGRLAELSGAVRLREGQCGALVAIGGRFAVLDYVGRADVFADLLGPLVQGYALDALEAWDEGGAVDAPSPGDASGFVSLVLGTEAAGARSIGLGQDLRFAADGVAGAGLATDGGLVQLTAFPDDGGEPGSVPERIQPHPQAVASPAPRSPVSRSGGQQWAELLEELRLLRRLGRAAE